MQGFIQNLQDLNWWLGVVIVGLVINLASDYLKPRIDSVLGRYSKKRSVENEKRRKETERAVSILLEDTSGVEVIRLESRRNRFLIRFHAYLISAVLIIIASTVSQLTTLSLLIVLGIVVALLVMSFSTMTISGQIQDLLFEHDKQLNKRKNRDDKWLKNIFYS